MTNSITWRSPSNIAIIKYWGKKPNQIPANPSLSFTLENSYSETTLKFSEKKSPSEKIELKFLFEGKEQPTFAQKIEKYFEALSQKEFPFLKNYTFEISSHNSFPHSAGIASSASGMSALALCLCSMEEKVLNKKHDPYGFFQKASHIARLGSGSASRSVYGGVVTWGATKTISGSSDEFATPFSGKLHEVFENFHDDILIVSAEKKSVSSRAGHELMNSHPFAEKRYLQAEENLAGLIKVLETGDMEKFCEIAENEALTLHALMMSSKPPVILLQPNTIEIVNRIRSFREKTGIPVTFTIDAGPNIHLLYPDKYKNDLRQLIDHELVVFCAGNQIISDHIGKGPRRLDV